MAGVVFGYSMDRTSKPSLRGTSEDRLLKE